MKPPAIDSAVQTTPPIIMAAIIPLVPLNPALTNTKELKINVINVIPDTGFEPTIAIAFAATVVNRNEMTNTIKVAMIGVPALAFALGMFIPLDLNTPLLIGGLVSWYVGTRSKDENVNKARRERGTLIASGFIAGGALMGVISAILKYCGADRIVGCSRK